MKLTHLALCAAALALVACGQPSETADTATPAAPQSRAEALAGMSETDQIVGAYQDFAVHMQAHPELTPPCQNVRSTERLGVVPDTVAADGVYAAHIGATVFVVQCGVLESMAPMDPRERWLVIYAPQASAPEIVNCAGQDGRSRCPALNPPT